MKKKSTTYNSQEEMKEFFDRAKVTIEVLTANMVRPDLCNNILFAHYKEVNRNGAIKLLLRCRQLYTARNDVIKILRLVIEAEELIKPKSITWRILQDDSKR